MNHGFVSLIQGYLTDGPGAVVMTHGDNGTAIVKNVSDIITATEGWPGQ